MRRTRKEDYLLFKDDIDQLVRELRREYGVNIISKQNKNGKNKDGTQRFYTMYKLNGHNIMRLNDDNCYRGVTGVSFSRHCYSNDDYRQLDEYLRPKNGKDLENSDLLKTSDRMYGFKIKDIMGDLKLIKMYLTVGILNSKKEYNITNRIEKEMR